MENNWKLFVMLSKRACVNFYIDDQVIFLPVFDTCYDAKQRNTLIKQVGMVLNWCLLTFPHPLTCLQPLLLMSNELTDYTVSSSAKIMILSWSVKIASFKSCCTPADRGGATEKAAYGNSLQHLMMERVCCSRCQDWAEQAVGVTHVLLRISVSCMCRFTDYTQLNFIADFASHHLNPKNC